MNDEIKMFCERIFAAGLSDSHGANVSQKSGEKMLITRRDAMLSDIGDNDVLELSLSSGADPSEAPKETVMHRAIYKSTNALAVIYTISPYAVAISISDSKVVPQDLRGTSILRSVPVTRVSDQITEDEANKIAQGLLSKDSGVVVVKGRGAFAYAKSLSEALKLATVLENSCKILIALRSTSQARPQPSPAQHRERPGEARRAIPPGIGVMDRSRYRRKF